MSILMNQIVLNATRVISSPPVVFPAKTIRFQFSDNNFIPETGQTETSTSIAGTWTRISASPNIWDWQYDSTSWAGINASVGMFYLDASLCGSCSILKADFSGVSDVTYLFPYSYGLVDVSNLTNTNSITNANFMFNYCSNLTSIQLFDTSTIGSMRSMFSYCTSLETIPLFDTSSVTNVSSMFRGCTNVESGALALYQQVSSQTTPPSSYSQCFTNCGSNTTTGAAELAQIPSSWGGTGT